MWEIFAAGKIYENEIEIYSSGKVCKKARIRGNLSYIMKISVIDVYVCVDLYMYKDRINIAWKLRVILVDLLQKHTTRRNFRKLNKLTCGLTCNKRRLTLHRNCWCYQNLVLWVTFSSVSATTKRKLNQLLFQIIGSLYVCLFVSSFLWDVW